MAASATSEGALLAVCPSTKHDSSKASLGKDVVDPRASSVRERDTVAVRFSELFGRMLFSYRNHP